MAKMKTLGLTELENKFAVLHAGREIIKNAIEAGAEKFVELEQGAIRQNRHIRTGSMEQSVAPGKYYETMDGGYTYVYPQGDDPKGVRQATKAFVINYGKYGRKTPKTGDKFITKLQKSSADEVRSAMVQAFNEAIQGRN